MSNYFTHFLLFFNDSKLGLDQFKLLLNVENLQLFSFKMIILSSVLVGSKITSTLLILKEALILFSLEFLQRFLHFLNAFANFLGFQRLILCVSIRISFDPFFSRSFLVRIWLVCLSDLLMEFLFLSLEECSLFLCLLLSEDGILGCSYLFFLCIESNLFFDSQHLNCLSLDMTLMVINDSGNFPFKFLALKFAFH